MNRWNWKQYQPSGGSHILTVAAARILSICLNSKFQFSCCNLCKFGFNWHISNNNFILPKWVYLKKEKTEVRIYDSQSSESSIGAKLPSISTHWTTMQRIFFCRSEESVQSQGTAQCVYILLFLTLVWLSEENTTLQNSDVCCLLISVFSLSLLSLGYFFPPLQLTNAFKKPAVFSSWLPKTDSFGGQTQDCFPTASLSVFFPSSSQSDLIDSGKDS